MQFRCFKCGLKFHDGPPPLEAMSDIQSAYVGVDEHVDRSVLDGTPLEGLSPYNFCAFCITVIREFPSVMSDDNGHRLIQDHRAVSCSCGFSYCGSEKAEFGWEHVPPEGVERRNMWRWINRMAWLHTAKSIYGNGDFSLLEELIHKEV